MFRTEIETKPYDFKLAHEDSFVSLGSCFSDSIGQKLKEAKFNILVNPFGTVFHPMAIYNLLQHTLEKTSIGEENIIERDGLFLSHDLHSSFKAKSKEALINKCDKMSKRMRKQLKSAKVLIITFGTSWVYEKKESQKLVSNCHKVPQQEFNKRLLSLDEILNGFFAMKEKLELANPELKIILTVSPVRHTKEGLVGNSVSKSNLLLACHYLSQMAKNVYYFPSYEVMMDDLRDYRFYGPDCIHPNEQAIDYIWSKFSNTLFTQEAKDLCQELTKLNGHLSHKAFNPKSPSHQQFLKQTLSKAEALHQKVNLKKEISLLKSKIHD